MKKATRILALALCFVMCLGLFVGCNNGGSSDSDTPLVVGYAPFNQKFSPFFSETAYDQDVYAMTALSLLGNDRQGAMILNGIEGEKNTYNGTEYTYYGPANCTITQNADGTVYYDFKLREDLKFSDGEPVTIDDVIFSMYVLCDPTYDGSSTLYAQPIEGLDAYRAGMTTLANAIGTAGRDNADFTLWTEDQQKAFWADFDAAIVPFAQGIVDYCVAYGAAAEGDVAAASAAWGFSGTATTVEEFALEIGNQYGWNFTAMEAEVGDSDSLSAMMSEEVYNNYPTTGVKTGDSADYISGIQKVDDYNMRVVMTKVDATSIYQLSLVIAPLHYYGSDELYDYDAHKFGFPKGDLSLVRAKTTTPMGAGPYKFIKFENGVVNFEANENYYLGCPKTKYVNFLETQEDDKLNGIVTGTIDITDPSFSSDTVKTVKAENGNDDITGPKITTSTVDNLGYGYIGINAYCVNVGGDPGSDASKALRKGFATVLSVYRGVAVESYYGERAAIINYPISNTSWAAPQAADEGYKVAFSTDAQGNDIYTSGMSAEEQYAAAKAAALTWFEAAGCKVENGKVVSNPEGGMDTADWALEYEVQIPADGKGDHPAFMCLTESSKALEEIGVHLIVTDLSDSSGLWDAISARQVEMWAAAWGATIDPDMYQIYYSDVANFTSDLGTGKNPYGGPNQGGSNYDYCIADAELDKLILDARASLDQSYRKTMYKECLDIIVDWAVEIPVYQRQNAIVFSTERVNIDTVTPDITTFYGWMSEIQDLELN